MINTYLREETVNGVRTFKTYAKVNELRIDPQNPRDITDENKESLKLFLNKYGRLMPFLVDTREEKQGQLIGGNKSFECMQELGIEEVWVEFRQPESDAQAFEMATLHNMEFGKYVESKLLPLLNAHKAEIDLTKLHVQLFNTSSQLDAILRTNIPAGQLPGFPGSGDGATSPNQELNLADLSKNLDTKCPRCGFEFNSKV